MKTKLYGLLHPITGELRYVGKTCKKTLSRRLSGHISDSKTGQTYRARWVRSLLAQGLKPAIELLDEVEGDGASAEVAMIGVARSLGCRLTNTTDGGEGVTGHVASAETKRKLREAHLGKGHTTETRAKMAATRKGMPKTAEWKARIGAANKQTALAYQTRKRAAKLFNLLVSSAVSHA